MSVTVTLVTSTYTVTEPDPDDSWDNGEDAVTLDGVLAHLTDAKPDPEDTYSWYSDGAVFDLDVKAGDPVYVVIGRYGTGDTFGHTDGAVQLFDAFSNREQADKLKQKLEDHVDVRTYTKSNKKALANPWSLDFEGRTYHVPWNGYFEHFESVDVHEIVVQ